MIRLSLVGLITFDYDVITLRYNNVTSLISKWYQEMSALFFVCFLSYVVKRDLKFVFGLYENDKAG